MMNQVERIRAMETRMDRVRTALEQGTLGAVEEDVDVLCAYYTGGQWKADYEADERDELPNHLKRGVLSQDGLYDLLEEWHTVKQEENV